MPDLVIVPTAVVPGDGAQITNGIAGAAIVAGDVVALDATTQRFVLASTASVALARVRGIASCNAAIGQPVRVQTGGILNVGGALLTIGEIYCLSGLTPGKIGPVSDLGLADFVTVLGIGQTTSLLQMRLWLTELAKA